MIPLLRFGKIEQIQAFTRLLFFGTNHILVYSALLKLKMVFENNVASSLFVGAGVCSDVLRCTGRSSAMIMFIICGRGCNTLSRIWLTNSKPDPVTAKHCSLFFAAKIAGVRKSGSQWL